MKREIAFFKDHRAVSGNALLETMRSVGMSDEEIQQALLAQLIERAKKKGFRVATEWEAQNLDPRELFKSNHGGPAFVRDESGVQQLHQADADHVLAVDPVIDEE